MIILGVPTNINEMAADAIAAGEIAPWEPGEGYVLNVCARCQSDIWLGPRQLLALDMAPPDYYTLLCMPCGIRLNPNSQIIHLGGR